MSAARPDTFEHVTRSALVGVELVDPVTLSRVSEGVDLLAVGLSGKPTKSWSGIFVWLDEDGKWPAAFEIDVGTLPYERMKAVAPPDRPPDLKNAPASARLKRVWLRPSAAYPFPDGVTGVRARLRETADAQSAPIAGADAWLQWSVDTQTGPRWIDAPVHATTSPLGEFVAFFRTPSAQTPTVDKGKLTLRVVVRHANVMHMQEVSVPDGQITALPAPLAWDVMTPG